MKERSRRREEIQSPMKGRHDANEPQSKANKHESQNRPYVTNLQHLRTSGAEGVHWQEIQSPMKGRHDANEPQSKANKHESQNRPYVTNLQHLRTSGAEGVHWQAGSFCGNCAPHVRLLTSAATLSIALAERAKWQ